MSIGFLLMIVLGGSNDKDILEAALERQEINLALREVLSIFKYFANSNSNSAKNQRKRRTQKT